ncbi:MAG: LamG domain-containing protein [Flavobacteriaceae bacterium]
MKSLFKLTLTFLFFAVLTFSCQDEEVIIENPSEEEVIQPGSSLSNLMRMTVTNDGAQDNLLDNSSCTEIVLPVTITISETTITINSLDDLWMVAELLNNPAGNDGIEFTFPITVTFGNYTQIVIENQDQLNSIVEECLTEPEVIECVDFVYPISFSIYNTDFQVIDTVQINSDEELYVFLDDLDAANEGAVLASLNFPVTLVYANGNTQEVNSNQELETAINQAEADCNNEGCQEEQVDSHLINCHWMVISFDDDTELFANYLFYFNENGTGTIIDGDTLVAFGDFGWSTSNTDNGVIITISNAVIESGALNGEWLVSTCNVDEFVMSQVSATGTIELIMHQDCTEVENPFSCFSDTTLTACDYDADGIATFELETLVLGNVLCDYDFTPSFHVSHADAEAAMNALPFPNSYQNTSNPETIYLRIESNSGAFQVFEINLVVEPCATDCSEMDVDGFLQTCAWNIVNYNGSNDLIDFEFNFDDNQVLTVTGMGATYTGGWSTSQSANGGVEVVFDNVAGPSIQTINGNWIVTDCQEDRLEFINPMTESTMVMEINCQTGCTNPGFLTNDLILYMPFSNQAKDLISGYEAANITNSFVEDRSGNATCAMAFTGNDYFTIPVTDQNELVQGDSFSISLWFKMQDTNVGNLEVFFRKPGNATVGFQLGVYDLNTPLFFDNSAFSLWDQDWNQEVDVVWDNTDWHHLVVTVDSNNTVRLYRDGVLRNIVENSNLTIGLDPTSQYLLGEGFQGFLDDLRVYKRTLSDNEVGDLYNLEGDCYQCL